jgi:hypothetical protein
MGYAILVILIGLVILCIIDNMFFYKMPRIDETTGIMYCPDCGAIVGNIYNNSHHDEYCHNCHLCINYNNIKNRKL